MRGEGVAGRRGGDVATTLLVLLTLVTFGGVLANGFVNWDDPVYLLENPLMTLPFAAALRSALTEFPLGNYHPLTSLGQWLEFRFFAAAPAGYHLLSLLTHLLNTLLLYFLLRRLGAAALIASLATAFFALHPLRVEAVAWVSAQKDLWSCFWVLLTLHGYLCWLRNPARPLATYLGTLVAALLAMLCKGTAMVLPLLLVIVDFYAERPRGRSAWLDKLPFLVLALLAGGAALLARNAFQGVLEEGAGWGGFGLSLYRLVYSYGVKSLLPVAHLFPIYPAESGGAVTLLLGGGMLLGLAALGWWGWRHGWRKAVLGGLFFVVVLLPVLALPNLGYAGDRFTYAAAIGLSLLLAPCLQRVLNARSAGWRRGFPVLVGIYILLLAALSMQQVRIWHDSEALISEFVVLYRANPGRELYLSLALETRGGMRQLAGDRKRGETDLADAHRVRPQLAAGLIDGGEWLLGRERYEEAASNFSRAAALDPGNFRVYFDRSLAYREQGRWNEALLDADQAIRLAPEQAAVYNNRGTIRQRCGQLAQALGDFDRAVALDGLSEIPYFNRGVTYALLGRTAEARQDFATVLRLNPSHNEAREWLARLGTD